MYYNNMYYVQLYYNITNIHAALALANEVSLPAVKKNQIEFGEFSDTTYLLSNST